MRSQRTRQQSIATVGLKHRLFGQRLGVRIMAQPRIWVGSRLVHPILIVTRKGNARAAAQDQLADPLSRAASDDVFRAHRVDRMKVLPRPPNPCDGRGVKHDVDALECFAHFPSITHVSLDRLDTKLVQFGIQFA